MTIQLNPFHAYLGSGERRTLSEIEAAANASNGFSALHRQPTQPPPALARVSEWLSQQGVHLGKEHFTNFVDTPNPVQFHQGTSVFARTNDKSTSRRPRGRTAQAGTVAEPFYSAVHTPSTSRNFASRKLLSNGLKRKASELDDSGDVIIVQPGPNTHKRTPKPAAFVDLTKDDGEERQTTSHSHQDDDVIIIDPPAAEMRRQLRSLVVGPARGSNTRAEKRRRPGLASTTERLTMRMRPEATAEATIAPEVDAAETSVLLQSVESVTHIFTLATEIRDKIYRHLLVSPKPIHVQHLWTEMARRSSRHGRSGHDVDAAIDTNILSVCRRTAVEGTRILYSENSFLYMLRDPDDVNPNGSGSGVRRSQRNTTRGRDQERRTINLAKYGHLIRRMAIELEPNRTGTAYEKLMCAALETLGPADAGTLPSPPRPLCGPIHLHTLTITVSPLFQSSRRTIQAQAQANQDVAIREGRFLSMVGFFSRGAPVLKALQLLNVDFLRINVHVNSDFENGRSAVNPWFDLAVDEVDSELDDDADDSDAASAVGTQRPERRHLETTIDLRYLPRHMEALSRNGPMGRLWANDALMREMRRQKTAKAEDTLANLRRHIEEACLEPEKVLREGIWEDYSAAERRRREQRAKEDARFEGDAYDELEEGGDDDDWRVAQGQMKSLIISIDRVGDELRAYRA